MNKADINRCLTRLFVDRKDDLFLTDSVSGSRLTYGQFEDAARRYAAIFAGRLKDSGKGCRIVTVCANNYRLLCIYWAALMLGANIVPLDSLKGKQEICDMAGMVDADLVISDVPTELDNNLLLNELDRLAENGAEFDFTGYGTVDYEADYLTVFTSGSTGVAKGVVHSFKDLYLSAVSFGRMFDFSEKNVFFHNFPMSFMAGILNTFIKPLVCGSSIVVGERQSVTSVFNFWNVAIKYSINTFWFNPTFAHLLLQLDRGTAGIDYCRNHTITACIGTAPLDIKVKHAFEEKYGIELFESFGLSETLFIATNTPKVKRVAGSVGQPLEGVKLLFSDDSEIVLDTPWSLKRYLGGDDLRNKPFPSGDLGEVDLAGNLFITGRKKDLIIKGGINVSPLKIEKYVNGHFKIDGLLLVLGVPDSVMGEKTVLFYQDENLSADQQKEINIAVQRDLGKDYIIDKFIFLKSFPLNVNGKIDKPKMRRDFAQ